MLNHATAFSSFSVDDLEKAKHFYRHVLAIQVAENPMGLLKLKLANDVEVMLYQRMIMFRPFLLYLIFMCMALTK